MRYFASMLEPLRIGFPIGALMFAALALQLHFELVDYTLYRWIAIALASAISVSLYYRPKISRSQNFRDAWFTGFTSISAGCLVYAALIFVFKSVIIEYGDIAMSGHLYQLVIFEFMSQLMFAILIHTLVSFMASKV